MSDIFIMAEGRGTTTPRLENLFSGEPWQHSSPGRGHAQQVWYGVAHYTGPATDPQLEALTRRAYTRRRSRLVDRWLQYSDAEGFTGRGVRA